MNKKEQQFITVVTNYYKEQGRHSLPWRKTKDPYAILVSEMMLQQTQVDRVIPKYEAFLKKFPTVKKLASASLADVLTLWQGLGYNRRAKMLHQCAQKIVKEYKETFPKTRTALEALPGIGPYTASAIMTFAFNTPTTLIETNVRSVYLHHFFKDDSQVDDKELLPLIEKTRDEKNPRMWYYALMDYGTYIKKTYGNPNKRSVHYAKQSAFEGSDRQIRGAIVRMLTGAKATRTDLHRALSSFEDIRIDAQIEQLKSEGMIIQKGRKYSLPS